MYGRSVGLSYSTGLSKHSNFINTVLMLSGPCYGTQLRVPVYPCIYLHIIYLCKINLCARLGGAVAPNECPLAAITFFLCERDIGTFWSPAQITALFKRRD